MPGVLGSTDHSLVQLHEPPDVSDPMERQQEVDQVAPGIFIWQAYDSKARADLFATALETPAGIWIVDPIPLQEDGLELLRTRTKLAGLFVTNENHARAATEFARTLSVTLHVHDSLRQNREFPRAELVRDGEMFSAGLTAVAIDGGPAGETALYCENNGGTMVVGDALINFEPYGFAFLPDKYCVNPSLMRRSLRKLLKYDFERILFAHGTPILSDARTCVERLLES